MTSDNVRGDRLRGACEVVGIKSLKELAARLSDAGATRGFSYAKLVKISAGTATLSPQDADFIAKSLGLPSSFFTAPLDRLGDVLAGPAGVASPPLQALADLTGELHDELDRRLDRAAAGSDPDLPETDQQRRARAGTRR